jgi:hypothetical protein
MRRQIPPATSPKVSDVLQLKHMLDRIEVIAPKRAAELLDVNVRTVYRRLDDGKLEAISRRGKLWVSLRSIHRYLEEGYGSTTAFNVLENLRQL